MLTLTDVILKKKLMYDTGLTLSHKDTQLLLVLLRVVRKDLFPYFFLQWMGVKERNESYIQKKNTLSL
jgi:hypothetical protein